MPNWCSNQLLFENESDCDKVWKCMAVPHLKERFDFVSQNIFFIKCETISFNKIIPEPKTKEECPERYIKTVESLSDDPRPWFDWYNWRCDNWGVKWDASDVYLDLNEKSISFSTPWGPPCSSLLEEIAIKAQVNFSHISDDGEGNWIPYEYKYHPDGSCEECYAAWLEEWNEE